MKITDVIGLGEASDCFGHKNPLVIKAIVDEELKRHLEGQDPLDVCRLTGKMRGLVGRGLGYEGPVIRAISGIELALWDLAGKARGKPVYRLLGGALRDRIPLCASGSVDFGQSPEWYVNYYRPFLDRGIHALKLRIGFNLDWDIELVAGVRRLVSKEIAILVDAVSNYTLETAIGLARALAPYDVYLLEARSNRNSISSPATRSCRCQESMDVCDSPKDRVGGVSLKEGILEAYPYVSRGGSVWMPEYGVPHL